MWGGGMEIFVQSSVQHELYVPITHVQTEKM